MADIRKMITYRRTHGLTESVRKYYVSPSKIEAMVSDPPKEIGWIIPEGRVLDASVRDVIDLDDWVGVTVRFQIGTPSMTHDLVVGFTAEEDGSLTYVGVTDYATRENDNGYYAEWREGCPVVYTHNTEHISRDEFEGEEILSIVDRII